jgi:hypothetical protein
MSPSILRLRLWNDRRWKKAALLLWCLDSPSKSSSTSATGSGGAGDGVRKLPLVLAPGRVFSVLLISDTHFLAGPLSSVPSTFPAFSGTISWNLDGGGIENPSGMGEWMNPEKTG